MMAIIVVAQTL